MATLVYTVPSSGTIDLSTLIFYATQAINNGVTSGTIPDTLRECAPFYGVSTSGTVAMSDFRGGTIIYFNDVIDGGGNW